MEAWSQGSFLLYGLTFFTESGYQSASRSYPGFKEDIELVDLTGKSVIVTGANSGIGRGSAEYFVRRGATVHMVCRNIERGKEAQKAIFEHLLAFRKQQQLEPLDEDELNGRVRLHIVDLAEPKQIRNFVNMFQEMFHVDILVNNAGVMLDSFQTNSEGTEMHFAINSLSNFLLTELLVPTLKVSLDPRVIFVSSGGLLTEKLKIRHKYLKQKGQWNGRTAYARTKRHQIVLAKKFSLVHPDIKFYSMHPGWTETPQVSVAMPDFYAAMKEKLRTIPHGCDTINWLAVTKTLETHPENDKTYNGEFFRDRQVEIQHFCISKTRYSSYAIDSLWNWCKECCGLGRTAKELRTLVDSTLEILSSEGAIKTRTMRLTSYKRTVLAQDLITSLVEAIKRQGMVSGVLPEALSCSQLFVEYGYLHAVVPPTVPPTIDSTMLYKFRQVPSVEELKEMTNSDWRNSLINLLDIDGTSGGWLLEKDFHDQNNTTIYSRSVAISKLKVIKVSAVSTEASVNQLVSLLNDDLIPRHKEWNKTFSDGRIIDEVTPSLQVHYWLYKVAPLEPRDFVVVRRKKKLPDGGIAIFEKSIKHGRVPRLKNAIRCELLYQVRYFKARNKQNDPSLPGCEFKALNLTDIKGWIPPAIANSSNIDISFEETKHILEAARNTILIDTPNNDTENSFNNKNSSSSDVGSTVITFDPSLKN